MGKVRGPLLSMSARGQIGSSHVFASWRGVPYVRQYAIPANPRTSAQLEIRQPFRWLQDAYRSAPGDLVTVYQAFASGRPLTDRNAWTKINLGALQAQTDISQLTYSPGARGGPAPASVSVTGGAASITVSITPPTLPPGWAVLRAVAVALIDQSPQDVFVGPWASGVNSAPPYSVTLSGLQAATSYLAGGWLVYSRPDGQEAYSASLQQVVTTT